MNNPLIAIFATVILDAMGTGIIFPILPALLKDITHAENVALFVGILTALYALMQFIFAPLVGALSDRFGRRPVLLFSLGGAAISYIFMTFATSLPLLILGRAIAGITGASLPVAMAYLTDISPPEKRARHFGLFNAMFGIGFILGPVLGGMLGDYWARLPFLAASFLNGCNFLLVLFVLPETRTASRSSFRPAALNPLFPLRWLLTTEGVLPIVFTFFILGFAGEACGICWAMWGHDAFRWNGFMVGLSLGIFGFFQTFSQVFLPGPAVSILGERGAILTGITALCAALCAMAFATDGWMVFAIMPVFALGGIGTPALQALASRQAGADQQGQLQGILSSAMSLSSVIAPLFFSVFYFTVRNDWPGAIWLVAAITNVIAAPLVLYGIRTSNSVQRKAEE
ncbi:Tet [Xenorhabdus mauleonii]|uniref:Tet n=1 Tax=Xenorhabdus mauleonii TaxID=351675 RepID=A0A1I3LXV4_9GAMM|nr:TCR/Tet family MFS transporter [Xenorhabdus mauleonii]PHM45337.1 Tet [Xenorhabdus mauleonii]SFI89611.1 MFS transporter, DHA1 family, tetracycline resistance protein [Xenorhabdus mauleonii]